MDLGWILEGFERPGEPEWRPKSMNFVDISPPRHRRPLGQGLGGSWIDLGRIGEGFARIWEGLKRILNEIWDGFRFNVRRFSD